MFKKFIIIIIRVFIKFLIVFVSTVNIRLAGIHLGFPSLPVRSLLLIAWGSAETINSCARKASLSVICWILSTSDLSRPSGESLAYRPQFLVSQCWPLHATVQESRFYYGPSLRTNPDFRVRDFTGCIPAPLGPTLLVETTDSKTLMY